MTDTLGGTSAITPDSAPTVAPAPMVTWSLMEALPLLITPSPRVTEPANPELPAIILDFPNIQLWAICTRLSILHPSPSTVLLNLALSTQELAPISTWLPITTLPI